MKRYAVKEIFGPTIQGEGDGTGEAVLFLRFAGCNKWSGRAEDKASSQCPFCDTDFLGGEKLMADEIVSRLESLSDKIRTIVISGGEPTLQLDYEIVAKLKRAKFRIYIETNGSRQLPPEVIELIDHISCSPKQPPHEIQLGRIDSMKVLHPPVTPDRHIEEFMRVPGLTIHQVDYYIQPVMDENYEDNLKKCLAFCYENPKVKLSIQLHKVIEVK